MYIHMDIKNGYHIISTRRTRISYYMRSWISIYTPGQDRLKLMEYLAYCLFIKNNVLYVNK